MIFDEFVTTITNDHIVPKVVDTILGSNVLTLRLMSNPRTWSGESLRIPVKVAKSTSGGSYDGYDLFSTQRVNTRQNFTFRVKGFYQSVTISGMEKGVNATKEGVLNLLATEMESSQQDMIDSIGSLFYGDGTGNGGKDFTGLAAAVDDGTTAANYGGLSRSTYTSLQSDRTNLAGALTLSAMAASYDAAKVGPDVPTIIVTTESIWSDYEALLQPTVRAGYDGFSGGRAVTATGVKSRDALNGEIGFDALFYRGTPLVADEKCTSGAMYFLNEKYLNWYALPRTDRQGVGKQGSNIEGAYSDQGVPVVSWTGLKEPINQDAEVGQFLINGELVNSNPNRSAVIVGIT